ncbi:hypothetical protein [Fulvivirga sedimenti]|uniref:Uncharacterized protein n=1 Tax=Fulvivirga sedimenti TaxID=2879465 RepID=A0A9X1HSP0_9BACT|nr:hypothetical protein [Fulvivirga sedimenti]MCA6075046.1 hypothetical protein [Fulvivirga sedimenti]MCA6076223.1 hypothetical protein [Fulvivirga sedimenti]MCA6077351.1 hypothetical protein [Fulvivirga sedimenti]
MIETLEEYALIAEIISAIAIIISLVFVGVQIKANTKATQASSFHEIAALDINILLNFSSSQELARLITVFRDNPDSLSEEEKMHGFYLFGAEVRHVENLFLQNENKMLSAKNWKSRKALVDGVVLSAGFGALLKHPFRKFFDGSFIDYGIDQRKKSGLTD